MAMDIKGVLQVLDGGSWVSIAVIKADEHRGVAGEIMRLAKCRIARRRSPGQQITDAAKSPRSGPPKNPNHWWNFTRNVELPNGMIRTIHPLFIFEINGRAVV